ncbi:MAG: GNAT family N-acetyltransferase [Thermoplasmatota archaeon]
MSDGLILEGVKYSDKEEIEELTKGIWEGHDYVPKVFDKWVEEGGFYKGILDGKIIAIDKYTWLEDGVIWLEGLRVHPEYQGMGYGREMLDRFMDIVDSLDPKKEKFMTATTKDEVKHMAEEGGFHLVQSYYYLYMDEEDIQEKSDENFEIGHEVKKGVSSQNIWDLVRSSDEYVANKGQYMANWIAHDMSETLVKDEVEGGNCFVVKERDEISGVIFFHFDEYRRIFSIPFAAGDEGCVVSLIRFGVKMGLEMGTSSYTIKTASEKIKECAEKAGMELADFEKALLFER